MAAIPALNQISQQHTNIYETFFSQANPSNTGTIGAGQAATFLKRSGLPEGILHMIWELADQGSKGYLDKQGFYISMKLISLAQGGKEVSLKNLLVPCSPPHMGDSPRLTQSVKKMSLSDTTSWGIKAKQKLQYDGIFDSLKPTNGLLSGDKVKPVLMNSKLPVDVLGKIWNLADIDQDGSLDRDEFSVAMHLVYRALDGETTPLTLPPHLVPPSKRSSTNTHTSMQSSVSTASSSPRSLDSGFDSSFVPDKQQWVVTPSAKQKYDQMFNQADTDKDGLVSGGEIKDILIASMLPQSVLAHIWGLCDTNNSGQLNAEQFALAMHMIEQKRQGKELPQVLSPEMIPSSTQKVASSNDLSSITLESTSCDFSAIKELDKISTDIEQLGREKASLQQEISQTEEAIRKRKLEIEDLQNELEKANKGLDVLSQQKTESQSKLNDLDSEKSRYKDMVNDIQSKCNDEQQMLNQLKSQLTLQQSSVKEQEQELQQGRKELDDLRKEEAELEQQVQQNKLTLETLKTKVNTTKSEIGQVQSNVDKLSKENNTLKDEISQLTISANAEISSTSLNEFQSLNDNFESRFKDVDQISARATAGSSPVSSISGFSVGSSGRIDEENDDFKENDPFKSGKSSLFGGEDNEIPDPFNSDDPFKSDPFKTVSFADDPFASDPFQNNDPFKSDPFKAPSTKEENHEASDKRPVPADPFSSLDLFGSGAFAGSTSTNSAFTTVDTKSPEPIVTDPFSSNSAFGTSDERDDPTSTISSKPPNDPFNSDPFGLSDPFGQSQQPDPFISGTNAPAVDPFSTKSSSASTDPFSSSSTKADLFSSASSDPFGASNTSDPFSSTANTTDNTDSWFAFANNKPPEPTQSKNEKIKSSSNEDTQLEWAKRESEREEQERQNKLKELQAREEMEIALALRQSVESSSDA